MKKIAYLILFFVVNILSFSSRGTYDETRFRQQIVNNALNNIQGATYSLDKRMGPKSFDCSGFTSVTLRQSGVTSISGRNSDYGTTANYLYQNSGNKISKTDYNSLKPGDVIHFSRPGAKNITGHIAIVVENLGNGKVITAEARGKKAGVGKFTRDLSKDSTYLGATSATQILINNGYTPINSSGQVVVPPNGSSVSTNAYGTASQDTVNIQYEPSNKMDWETFADNIMGFLKEGLDKFGNIGNIFIFIMTTFFIIQVIKDSIFAIADNNIKGFISGTIFKRTFGFVFYIFITNKIFSGELVQIGKDISYGILEKLTGEKTQKLNEIWTLKEKLASEVFEAITKLKWIYVWEIQKNLLLTIALLVIFVLINVAFLFIMFDLLKLLVGFELSLSLSPIFLTLGILDETRQYYNIGKIFSMIINFILKLVSINFFAIIGIKVLSENNTFQNLVDSLKDIDTMLTGDFILYIFLIFIIYTIIHKIEISF